MKLKKENKPIYLPEHLPQKKEENKLKILAMIIIPFFTFLLWLSGSSIGKSVTEYILQSKAQMAKPIIRIETDPLIEITSMEQEQLYHFTIKNYEGEEIADIDMQYTIEILGNNDQWLEFVLEKEGNLINLYDQKTEWIEMKGKEKKEEHYQLKIRYQKEKIPEDQDWPKTIQLKVHTEQVKP